MSRFRDTVAAQKLRELGLLVELVEAPIGERHRHRALSNRPGDPLRGAMTDVSGREQARHARLECNRIAVERPALRAATGLEQIGTRALRAAAMLTRS